MGTAYEQRGGAMPYNGYGGDAGAARGPQQFAGYGEYDADSFPKPYWAGEVCSSSHHAVYMLRR